MLGCKQLVRNRRSGRIGRRVLGRGNGIGRLLLQRRDLDYARGGNGMHRKRRRRWLHLLRWFLDLRWRYGDLGWRMHGSGKCVGNLVLQWRNLGYSDDRDGLHRHGHRRGLHLLQRFLDLG